MNDDIWWSRASLSFVFFSTQNDPKGFFARYRLQPKIINEMCFYEKKNLYPLLWSPLASYGWVVVVEKETEMGLMWRGCLGEKVVTTRISLIDYSLLKCENFESIWLHKAKSTYEKNWGRILFYKQFIF